MDTFTRNALIASIPWLIALVVVLVWAIRNRAEIREKVRVGFNDLIMATVRLGPELGLILILLGVVAIIGILLFQQQIEDILTFLGNQMPLEAP